MKANRKHKTRSLPAINKYNFVEAKNILHNAIQKLNHKESYNRKSLDIVQLKSILRQDVKQQLKEHDEHIQKCKTEICK